MTQIPPTPATQSSSSPATTKGASGASSTTPNDAISKNQFLLLMISELKNQDPLSSSSSDPTAYLSQLAQFTTLEQETNTAQSSAQTAAEQNTTTALALLGHTVSYQDASGNTLTGTVQKVDFTSAGPTLTINGTGGIDPTSVNEVS